ncbi:hypothetical protein ACERZ8_11160 [Tateyamaria armeniaca]|uniref:Asn/Gln amidotransferase domain-containing protein n=1 Tax=Tateyamaria armeniaca TaxID=2518930 RepID=A0ABW8UTH5_9RHOB
MAQKIGGITYPSTVAELLRERELTKLMMQTFTSPEVRHRFKFLINPPAADAVFSEYIAERSRTPISLPRHITQNATDLVTEDNYDPRLWKGILDLVEANCRTFLETEIFPEFFDESKSPTFKKVHTQKLFQAGEKKYGDVNSIMVRLNLTDAASVRGILAEMMRGNKSGARELAKYAINKARLKVSIEEVIDAIKTGKGLTNAGAFEVDTKKLSMCGFDKPKDPKLKNRVEDMVNAWMSGDKTTAKQIFALIQKNEPKDSFVQKDTIEGLFKAFKKFKVVIG